MAVSRFPKYGPLIIGLFFSILLLILLGFLIRWFRSRQRTETIRNLQSVDQFPPYVSKQLVFLTHSDIAPHLFAEAEDAPTHFSVSAKRILVQYLSVVLGMSCLSFTALSIYHALDPGASMITGDTLTLLLLTIWGFSPLVGFSLVCFLHFRYFRGSPNLLRYKSLYESIFSLFSISPHSLYQPAKGNEIPNWRINLLAVFFPMIVSTIQYLFCVAIGDLAFNNPPFLMQISNTFRYSYMPRTATSASESKIAFSGWIYTFFLGWIWDLFPPASANWGSGTGADGTAVFNGCSWAILAAVEEIGWMGVLFPCLLTLWKGNFMKASVATGIIWSSWHWGFIILGGVNALPDGAGYTPGVPSTPWTYAWFMFILTIVSLRVLICRLTLYTRSLYTAVIMHAVHNVWVISFYAQISREVRMNGRYEIGESGIILVIMYGAAAVRVLYTIWQSTRIMEDHQQHDQDIENHSNEQQEVNGLAVTKEKMEQHLREEKSVMNGNGLGIGGEKLIDGTLCTFDGAAAAATFEVKVQPDTKRDKHATSSVDMSPLTPLTRPLSASNAGAHPPMPTIFDRSHALLVPQLNSEQPSRPPSPAEMRGYVPPSQKDDGTEVRRERVSSFPSKSKSKSANPSSPPLSSRLSPHDSPGLFPVSPAVIRNRESDAVELTSNSPLNSKFHSDGRRQKSMLDEEKGGVRGKSPQKNPREKNISVVAFV